MSVLASVRPDSWNVPLFLHVLGAMVLVGGTGVGSLAALGSASSPEAAWLRHVAWRAFLLVALPAYLVMRVGAEWLYSKELGGAESDPTWIGIGYATADIGALVLVATLILSGLATRRQSAGLTRAAGILSALAVVAWLVTVWAMGGKPS